MLEHVTYYDYKGHDIRSNPFEVRDGQWKMRIDVTFVDLNGEVTVEECLDDTQFYATVLEAHEAGYRYGCGLVDDRMSGKGT